MHKYVCVCVSNAHDYVNFIFKYSSWSIKYKNNFFKKMHTHFGHILKNLLTWMTLQCGCSTYSDTGPIECAHLQTYMYISTIFAQCIAIPVSVPGIQFYCKPKHLAV